MTDDADALVDEVPVDPATARVYAEGWQSWSPATWHSATATGRVPGEDLGAPDAVPAGDPVTAEGVQGEGLVVVDPGTGAPGALLRHDRPGRGADHPDDGWSTTGCWCAAAAPSTSREHPDGESALVAYGDVLAATVPRRLPPPTGVVLLVPLLRGGHGRRRPRGRARPRRARPRRRRGAGGRRVEPRARRGAAARGAVRIAGGAWWTRCGRRGAGPASGWHRSSSARTPPWPASTPTGWSDRPAGTGDSYLVGLDLTHPGVQELLVDALRRLLDLGVDYLKLDFLYAGAVPGPAPGGRRPGSRLPSGPRAGARRGGARRLPGGLRRAAPAEPRPRRRHAGLPGHLPRGRRGRLDRAAGADATGRPGVAAGPAVGERPRLRRGPTVLLRSGSGGRGPPVAWAGCARSRTAWPTSTPWGLDTVRDLVAAGGRTAPFEADVLAESAALAQAEGAAVSDGTDRLAARIAPYLQLCYPLDHADVTRRLVALAETYAERSRPRADGAADPPDRLPDHLRRRHPTARRGAAAHPGRPSCTTMWGTCSATSTCCRSSRGPPTTGSRSSTTGWSTPPSAPGTT